MAWSAFAALALGQLLVDVDDVVLNIALPSVALDTGLSPSLVPWAVNSYLLCFGGLLLLGGRLADRSGHRAVLLAGVGVFVVASLLGAMADSPAQVIGARAGQGLAAALLAPSAMSLLVHTFPDPYRSIPGARAVGRGYRAGCGVRAGHRRRGDGVPRLAVDLHRQRRRRTRGGDFRPPAAAGRHR